jgi:hypothetical protein
MPDQQNLAKPTLSVLIFCAPTNRLRDLVPLVPAAISALRNIGCGEAVRITAAIGS